jgi:transcriptional regulator with XRE-family HTH domain
MTVPPGTGMRVGALHGRAGLLFLPQPRSMVFDPALTPGQRIKFFRERAGMSRRVLGGLVGRTDEWVKAVETGRLKPPRLPMLVRLAEVLGVKDLGDLTGDQSLPVGAFVQGRHPAAPAIRRVATRYTLQSPNAPSPPIPALRARVDAA